MSAIEQLKIYGTQGDREYYIRPYISDWNNLLKEEKAKFHKDKQFGAGWKINASDFDKFNKLVNDINQGRIKPSPKNVEIELLIEGGDKGITVVKYGQGYSLFGDVTKNYSEQLKKVANFNKNLILPKGGKGAGWVVSKKNLDFVAPIIKEVNEPLGLAFFQQPEVLSSSRYQRVTFDVEKPFMGQKVIIKINKEDNPDNGKHELEVTVSHLSPSRDSLNVEVIDLIGLNVNGSTYFAAITGGLWSIIDYGRRHILEFY